MEENNSSGRSQAMTDVITSKECRNSSTVTNSQVNAPNNLCEFQEADNTNQTISQDELNFSNVSGSGKEEGAVVEGGIMLGDTERCPNCKGLQKKLSEEEKRCAVLRANIHKVSANWFQRKSQLSESDADIDTSPVGLLDQTMRVEGDGAESASGGIDVSNVGDLREGASKSRDFTKLFSMIAQKSAQLEVSDSHCHDLKRRLRECEKIIDDKEDIIHGLKDQLETYLTDNQQMSLQLNNLVVLFQQLEKADQEVVSVPKTSQEDDDTATAVPLPTQDEFHEMTKSVSKTYIKLKDLIYEKKALVTEIERLNTLNVELQKRVVQQETRLMSVTDALHQTWLVVSDLKEQHAKLHDDELIMRYELKQKRNILTKLRKELESSRAQWQMIRQKNQESEEEYASIREMLRERRKETSESISEPEEQPEENDEAVCLHPDDTKSFDPPVDLLLEMGLEYGIIGEEAEMTQTVLKVIGGEDVRHNRLERLEEHCSLLYQKLLASTSRSLFLASRLSRLHRQFGSSDEDEEIEDFDMGAGEEEEEEEEGEADENQEDEDDDDQSDDGEEGAEYYTDADRMAMMESVLSSPVSEEYDTAYVSEAEAAEPQAELSPEVVEESMPGPSTEESLAHESDQPTAAETSDNMSSDMEESCDHLSRTLINFLPRKIEFLRKENKKLESQLKTVREEREAAEIRAGALEKDKNKLEEELKILAKDIAMEKLQRQQLEEQLKHLGKCVDQLKLDQQNEASNDKEQQSTSSSKSSSSTSTSSTPTTSSNSEPRSEGERRPEEEKLKKEVALLKREMEVKKKEKELRKREEELSKKEEELIRGKEGETDGITGSKNSRVSQVTSCASSVSDINAVIAAASRIVRENLQEQNTTVDYASSLLIVPSNAEEISTSRSSSQNNETPNDIHKPLLGDISNHSQETNDKSTYFVNRENENGGQKSESHMLRSERDDGEQTSETNSAISHEENKAKEAVPQTRSNKRGPVSNEGPKNVSEPQQEGRSKGTFVVAPVLNPDELNANGVTAQVSLAQHMALLLPFRFWTHGACVDTSTAVTHETHTQDAGPSCTRQLDTAKTGTSSTLTPATNKPEACTSNASGSAVTVRITAKCQSLHVTAFKHVSDPTHSSPSEEVGDASLVMPVMRVMKDEAITITITAHSHTVTTIVITSVHERDEAIVEYDIHKVPA